MTPPRTILMDPEIWPAVSRLLDEWLDLEPARRAEWLETLSPEYDRVLPMLRELLAAEVENGSFLNTLPPLPDSGEATGDGFAAHMAIGPYRLLRELGRGGMGVVWLAERADGSLKRPVALKLPLGWAHSGLAERFARERAILEQLVHPHIARLYDAGIAAGEQPWLALEYVDGETITAHCDGQALGIEPRLKLFLDVLRAVQYAHSNLVVHRDLKPSNILVTREGQVRLLDFGIAKLLTEGEARETELTRIGGRALTPDYASPEQIVSDPVTTASDVYSLGVVLYELLTGERPYRLKRDTRGGLEEAIVGADVVRPSRASASRKLARQLQGDLDTIVMKALARLPHERYTTADAFAQDIERYLKGEAILAQPESVWYRTRKFVGRNKLGVGAAAAVVIALSAGLGAALWEAHQARIQTRTAEAVESFLLDMFSANSSANPDPVKARQTTARQLLDIGAATIQSRLKDAPQARLRAVELLGNMYGDLGLVEQALTLKKLRVEIAKSVYGPMHPEVGRALAEMASNLEGTSMQNQWPTVVAEATRVLDYNQDYTSISRGRVYLASAVQTAYTNPSRASEFADKAVALYSRYPPSDMLAKALRIRGIVDRNLQRYGPALASLSEAARISETVQGDARNTLSAGYTHLGETQAMVLDLAGAEKSFRLALERAYAISGAEHFDVVQVKFRLGALLMQAGRIAEGRALLDESVNLALKVKGPDDVVHTVSAITASGRALHAYGEIEQGIARISQGIETHRRMRRTGIMAYAQRLDWRAAAEVELGEYDKAGEDIDESSRIWQNAGGLGAVFHLTPFVPRANLLLATGHAREAAAFLDQFAKQADGPGVMTKAGTDYAIARGETALALGRLQEARRLAGELRSKVEGSSSRGYLKMLESRILLIEGKTLLAAGQPAEALPLLERSVALGGEVYDPERSLKFAETEFVLGDCLASLGRTQEAHGLSARARVVRSRHRLGPTAPRASSSPSPGSGASD